MQTQKDELEHNMLSLKIITFLKRLRVITIGLVKIGIACTASVANCGLSLIFYEHSPAYAGLLQKQRRRTMLILFLQSHSCTAKILSQ